jgi:hypothetical protein
MRKPGIIAAIAIAIVTIGPAAAAESAPRAKVASSLEIDGRGYGPGEANVDGFIESGREACLENRRIRMFAIRQGGKAKALSVDVSSMNGFWGGEGETSTPKAFRVVMSPRDISRRKTCTGDRTREQIPTGPGFARTEFPTGLVLDGSSSTPTSFQAEGSITARKACRSKRRVNIFGLTVSGPVFAGFDRASRNGFFGGGGEVSGVMDVRAVAPAKDLPGPDSCAEGSDEI